MVSLLGWLMRSFHGSAASVALAVATSTAVTSAVALPLGVTALEASGEQVTIQDQIHTSDHRFPAPVELRTDELAAGVDTGSNDNEPAGESSDAQAATVTPAPDGMATPTPAGPNENDASVPAGEVPLLFPTPTPAQRLEQATPSATPEAADPTAPATPTPDDPDPTPTTPPSTPTPTPEPTPSPTLRVEPTPDPTPRPSPTPTTPTPTPEPTPTAEPTATATPTPTVQPGEADVYAFISPERRLRVDRSGKVYVKAVNHGPDSATQLVMHIAVSGADVNHVAPHAGWTCTGGGSAWTCTGSVVQPGDAGRNVVHLTPSDRDVLVHISITHAVSDPNPGNNETSLTMRARLGDDDDDDDDDHD